MVFCYAWTKTGDAQLGEISCYGVDRGRRNTTVGEAGNQTTGGDCGAGPIINLRKNKRRSLGTEWSMSKVGTPPPHNSEKPQGLVGSINNINNKKNRPSDIMRSTILNVRQLLLVDTIF